MKNATAVFGDYGQYSKSTTVQLEKPHYYPSNMKDLDENARKTGLTQRYVDPPQPIIGGENANKNAALPESRGSFFSFGEDLSGSSKYNESWPATEQSSISKYPEDSPVEKVSNKEHSIEDYLEQHGEDKENHGTLSQFVQRFREQPPLPRSERKSQKMKKVDEFWWLSSPSRFTSSTPISSDSSTLSLNSLPFSSAVTDQSSITPGTKSRQKDLRSLYSEESDSITARMQLRTDKLLELSENAMGKTTSSSSVRTQNSVPMKYKDVSGKPEERIPHGTSLHQSNDIEANSLDVHKLSKPLHPEHDILYKWRLSRKMDLAAKSASPSPFLRLAEPKKYTSSKDRNDINEKVNDPCNLEVGVEYVSDSTSEKIPETNGSKNVCCKRNNQQNDIKSPEGKNYSTGIPHNSCKCMHDQSFPSCKTLDPEPGYLQCNCNCKRIPQISKCNAYCYHIPPVVHACDLFSCVHKECLNRRCQQTNERTVLENESLLNKKTENKDVMIKEEKQTALLTTKSSKNNIAPVINQVVSDHLFDNCDESIEMDSTHVGSVNGNTGYDMPPVEVSSSEDEFSNDDILRELRNRRRNNKKELKVVRERLKQCQERGNKT